MTNNNFSGTLLILLIVALGMLCPSCEFTENNKGYPNKISFPKDGGMQIAKGETFFYGLEIKDYSGEGDFARSPETDTLQVKYKWLTVKSPWHSNDLIVIAEPSQANQKRELIIIGWFGREYAEIKVRQ